MDEATKRFYARWLAEQYSGGTVSADEFEKWMEEKGYFAQVHGIADLQRYLTEFVDAGAVSAPSFDQPAAVPDVENQPAISGGGLEATGALSGFATTPQPRAMPFSGNFPIASDRGATDSSLRTKPHTGRDYALPEGTPVLSVKPGKVIFAGNGGDFGTTVVVQHEDGTEAQYSHLSQTAVLPGMAVESGTRLALSGSTGKSEGPHLHFEENPAGYSRRTYGMTPGMAGEPLAARTAPIGPVPPASIRSFTESLSGPTTNAEGDRFYPLYGRTEAERRYGERNVLRRAGFEPDNSPVGRQTLGYVPQLRDQLDIRDALTGVEKRPMADFASDLAGFLQRGQTNVFDDPISAMRQIAGLRSGTDLPMGQERLAMASEDPTTAADLMVDLLRGYLSPMMSASLPKVLERRTDAYRNLGSSPGMTALQFLMRMLQPPTAGG